MRLSDESVIEGGHLTPEERIALQAEEIKQLRHENEQLRAQVARMREALIFTKEKIYEQLSNYVNGPKKFKYSAISIECVQKIIRALADASDYHNPIIRRYFIEVEKACEKEMIEINEQTTCKTTGMPCCRCQPVCEHRSFEDCKYGIEKESGDVI